MSYWSERQKQLYKELEKDEIELKKRLSCFYDAEEKRLEKEISSFYARYGENNVIEYRKLLEKLSDNDVKLLMQDMDEFAKQHAQYAHLLPVRANVYKLDRLEGLQYTVMMQQLEIGAKNNAEITEHLLKQAHRSVNAVQEVMGFGKNFYAVNSDVVKNFVNVAWGNGSNFSDRIWSNSNKLASYLNTDIAQGFARGDSYDKLVKQVCERFKHVTRKDAYRLIYTEGTYVMAESCMKPFEADYEQYKISTAADGKVCELCADMAQQVFDIKDRVPGRNFPPFHPWCRCTFEIVVPDWDKWIDDYVQRHSSDKYQAEKMLKNIVDNDNISARGFSPNKDNKQNFDNLEKRLKKEYGIHLSKGVKILDFDLVAETIAGIESVISDVPELGYCLENITSRSMRSTMTCKGKGIVFNSIKFADKNTILSECEKCSNSGLWIKNASPSSLGVHEATHGLEWILDNYANTDDASIKMAWNNSTEASKIILRAYKNISSTEYAKGKSGYDLIKSISSYSNENPSEAMAEAFADVYANGSDANPFSIEIKKVALEQIEKYRKGK